MPPSRKVPGDREGCEDRVLSLYHHQREELQLSIHLWRGILERGPGEECPSSQQHTGGTAVANLDHEQLADRKVLV